MGGLMEVRSYQDNGSLPGMGDVPLLKELFGSENDGDRIVELVILLKASIGEGSQEPHAADERLVNDYMVDSRPL
jgi:general secretion pathway protein D